MTDDRTLPPSERAEIQKKLELNRKAAAAEERDRLVRAMRATFASPDGLVVLNWLRKECGFGEAILGATNGAIDERATLYQAMRLNLYIRIRKMLTFEILKEVEYEADQIS